MAASGLVAVSYLIYSSFDLLGRHFVGVRLPAGRFMRIAFVSYAFNLSLGAVIGAVAFRFRMYSRLGLDALQMSKLISLSVVTNWLGYATIAGCVFVSGRVSLPAGWDIEHSILRLVGALMLCTASAYMLLCAFSTRREFRVFNHVVQIPSLRLASLQLLVSSLHWPAEAAVVYVLLHGQLDFVTVLGALALTAIGSVITHIPAGIGILEATFVGLNGDRLPATELLAALLVFRALYFIAPLAVATLIYIGAETHNQNSATDRRCWILKLVAGVVARSIR